MRKVGNLLGTILVLSACTWAENSSISVVKIDNFSLLLPASYELQKSDSAKNNWIGFIRSASTKKASQQLQNGTYFDFKIGKSFQKISSQQWITAHCNAQANIAEEVSMNHIAILKLNRCSRQRTYLVQNGMTLIPFWEGDDSRDHERVWEILKSIRFDE